MPKPFAFNPFDIDTRRAPYELYARARREYPVYQHPGLPVVSVFRYEAILSVLKDASLWSSSFPMPPGMERPQHLPPSMIMVDAPEHTRLRGLVSQAFTPRVIRRLEPRMEEIARDLMDKALAKGHVDLVEVLTYPLPVIVIAEMIGVPTDDLPQFKEWSDALVADLGGGILEPPSQERMAKQVRIIEAMREYFTPLAEQRRYEPREDLLSGLVAAELEGSRLTFDEMLQMLILLLVAGNETTTNLIGNAAQVLMDHPAAAAELRARPELLPNAMEEILRFASPVQADVRYLTQETTMCDQVIPKGSFALLWLGSANRDEHFFPNGESFNIHREDIRHISFGFGPHYCLGANLARLEGLVAVRELLRRTKDFRRSDTAPLPIHPSFIFRGVTSLPVELIA